MCQLKTICGEMEIDSTVEIILSNYENNFDNLCSWQRMIAAGQNHLNHPHHERWYTGHKLILLLITNITIKQITPLTQSEIAGKKT